MEKKERDFPTRAITSKKMTNWEVDQKGVYGRGKRGLHKGKTVLYSKRLLFSPRNKPNPPHIRNPTKSHS